MVLRLEGIEKRYGKQAALGGVSLHVRRGDCYGFLGHNGAGKTTALRIALGLIRPDAGRVIVDGFDAAEHPREARARMGGLIETPGFYPWMSGRKNLVVPARLRGLSRRESSREADRLLEAVGLSPAGDRKVGGYSQGMRQRLGIAMALIGDPAIVLLDEPTNGLDPEGIEEFRRLLRRLTADEDRTVLLSSHQLKELAGVTNRIGILRRGRLLVEGETAELTAAGGRRHRLRTDDPEAARAALADLGIETGEPEEDLLLVPTDDVEPGAIAKALVSRGVEVRELASKTETLEDIYLRYSREEAGAPAAASKAPADVRAPAARLAPGLRTLAAFRQETARVLSHPGPVLALLLPAVVAALAVARRWAVSTGHLEEVAGGGLISQTLVTAFEGVAEALQTALPLAAVILAGLASQSIAGEYSRGTLRNLLLCPVGRMRLAIGKAFGVLALGAGTWALTVLVAVVASTIAFDFTDVVEILEIRGLVTVPSVTAAELWPPFLEMVPSLLVPLAAYTAFGFLAGALLRGSVSSLSLAVGGFVFLDLFRVVGRELGVERWLLSAHLPSPLGDTSWTRQMLDLILAPNSDPRGFTETALTVPFVWLAACLLLSGFLLSRRSVP